MWIIYSLLTAFFTSCVDVISRKISKNISPYVLSWAYITFSIPFLLIIFAFMPEPLEVEPVPFWIAAVASASTLVISTIFYFKAIESSELSISMPMLTFTPALLLLTSPLMLGEFPAPLGLSGVLMIVSGAYFLNLQTYKKGIFQPFRSLLNEKGARYMMLTAILYSIGANIDKIGVMNSAPFIWAIVLNSLLSVFLFPIMIKKRPDFVSQIRKNWIFLLSIGICFAAALAFQMTAIRMNIVPYIIAIKRMSVFFSSVFGFIIFKEQNMRERLIGVMLMVGGVFLISFFG
jgi:uncharacterized membrane protein